MKNFALIRRNSRMLVLMALLLVLTFGALSIQCRDAAPTPGFSAESGFYPEAFQLTLTVPEGCRVYYTLDSTTPDENSLCYSGPILISNASENENTFSMLNGMSTRNWAKAPDFLIDKCTVVRAVAIPEKPEANTVSQVVTKSYFVGFPRNHFMPCGVISIVTDPKNLFDSTTGIYVTGDPLVEYLATSEDPESLRWAYWPANYRQRGKEWERSASITFWDAEGGMQLSKEIGIRIQGGWSRAYVPKSLNLFAREEYDGNGQFEYDFFGTGCSLEAMTLSAGGTGFITRFNDYLMSQRAQGLDFGVQSFRPYVLFLDGEYWGFYWLTEKYDARYLQQTYQLDDAQDVIIIKASALEAGYEEDLSVYKQMVQFFANHDLSDPDNYQKACELIDLDSFLDYYATMIYIGRMKDWPNFNESLWRTRYTSEEPYADGKWRWLLFDCNSFCMTEDLITHDTLEWVLQESTLFRSLWQNPSFREDFETRILEIADRYFEAEQMLQFSQEYKQTMTDALCKTWTRFFGSENKRHQEFLTEMESLESFFSQRRAVVSSWFAES